MAVKYLYKCNPLVAKAAGTTSFDRYTWPDGTMLLWTSDLMAIDRVRFYTDNANFMADLGVVRMTDPEAAAEQKNPMIRLPEARLPQYRWEQPDFSVAAEVEEEIIAEAVGIEEAVLDAETLVAEEAAAGEEGGEEG